MSLMKKLKVSPNSDKSSGQKGDENHAGTISVPCALQFLGVIRPSKPKELEDKRNCFHAPNRRQKC